MEIMPKDFKRPPQPKGFWSRWKANRKAQFLAHKWTFKQVVTVVVLILVVIAAFNGGVAENLSKLGGMLRGLFTGGM